MFAEVLIAAAFQIGPFYEQRPDYAALRPFWSEEKRDTDVLWPIFTSHSDWWRFCLFTHYQDYGERGCQFEIMPIWWNGKQQGETYCGLFPIAGYHPHFLLMYDLKFGLWPLWTQYKMPRRDADNHQRWMKTNSILWPFFHWRDDGSWGFWPLYVQNHQRESEHKTALWPLITWANYQADRDTAGAGYSWMLFPLWASVERERESQWMFIPPLFSYDASKSGTRLRCPWPIFELEDRTDRWRLNIFPLYERINTLGYGQGEDKGKITRFLWKEVELYEDEIRVFPFWVSRDDDTYFRLWPFWERLTTKPDGSGSSVEYSHLFACFPIRWVSAIDRNWAKFWTFYESETWPCRTYHSLFWGIINWTTER